MYWGENLSRSLSNDGVGNAGLIIGCCEAFSAVLDELLLLYWGEFSLPACHHFTMLWCLWIMTNYLFFFKL